MKEVIVNKRRSTDKLTAIREFYDKWVEILPKLYNRGENVTVDEQLVGFRGRCPFKQYIPSKPAKYYVKIWTVCDSASSYALKTQVYLGKTPGAVREKNQGMQVVLDLVKELRGQNVTCDNFFTSYNLGQVLLKRKLTMLGTVRKNKVELPPIIPNKIVHSSDFYFTTDTTIVSYVPKKNKKSVILMSTLHHKGWRNSLHTAHRRLLVTLGNLSRDVSPSPAAKKEELPNLPVPELESTLQKYLAQVEVVAPAHLNKTRGLVRAFLSGPGPKLQQRLLERRQNTTNWATPWWLNDMYLSVPLALPVNSNPGFAARPKRFSNQHDAAVYLSRFISALLSYQELLDRSELEVERVKSKDGKSMQPLCMAQHYQMFRIYRAPGVNGDEQMILDRTNSGNHIIVAHHNQFYSVPVRAVDRGRITEAELAQQFSKIMEVPADPRTPPVGVLTSAKRPFWARAREELKKNPRNLHNLELLERCLCVICIDDDVLPATFNNPMKKEDRWIGDRDYANVLHHCIHGGGSRHFGANRWFDKTVNFILGKDGMWGMNYEHSAGEAPAVCNAFEDLTSTVDSMPPPEENQVQSHLPAPEKLEWYLSERSLNDIREAMTNFDSLAEDLDLCILWFEDYSKEFIKSCKISPDAYMQLALQLTYFRLHGKLVATYESAGIRRFALGRVDCIRSASPEALAWAKAMCQGEPDAQTTNQQNNAEEEGSKRVQFTIYSEDRIKELFDLAIQRQTKEINDNIYGYGIDNHLMGLRYAAEEAGEPIPSIFTDEAYKIVNHFALSTSQITTKNDMIGGYGPVVPDGYGCGYNLRKNGFIFSVSAFHSDGQTNAKRFAQTLEQSLRDMASMLKSTNQ